MINALRDLLPRDKPWSIGAVAGFFGLLSFVFQALPLVVLLGLRGNAAVGALALVPGMGLIVAVTVAYSHNQRLRLLSTSQG